MRRGYEWDNGLHYVGEMQDPTQLGYKLFNYITNGKLTWADMGEVYDTMVFGSKKYHYQKGTEAFRETMKSYFPAPQDQQAIDAYLTRIDSSHGYSVPYFSEKTFPWLLRFLFGKLMRKNALKNNLSTLEVLQQITTNKQLIAVLTAQFGDYGLEPSKSSFFMHTALFNHYKNGGSYPVGGSSQIFETIAPVICQAGGELFTHAKVEQILVENGKAIGVKMADGATILANVVVSSTGIYNTYNKLLPAAATKQKEVENVLQEVKLSVGHVCLYIGLRHTQAELNLPKANYWVFPDNYDHDKNVADYIQNPASEIPVAYISFPSAKDPDWQRRYPNRSTIQIITLSPMAWYKKWDKTQWMKRGEEYEQMKEQLSLRLLEKLFEQEPHLRNKIDYYELSTPLSTKHFTNNNQGELYGLEHSPARFANENIRFSTSIKNLFLCGQDTITCGVSASAISGLMAASLIVKRPLLLKL